jgi:hypothetical protein
MKVQYMAPQLRVYGNVDALTQVLGNRPTPDTLIINGVPQDVDGSGSINIP